MIADLLDAFQILARNIYSCSFQAGVEEAGICGLAYQTARKKGKQMLL